jgi:DNA-binding CsgD family transcriptional regulator
MTLRFQPSHPHPAPRSQFVLQVFLPDPVAQAEIEECLRSQRFPILRDARLEIDTRIGTVSAMVKITPRELEVLSALVQYDYAWEMAPHLGISPKAVDNHIQRLMEKLEVGSRHRLVARAVEIGLIAVAETPPG